MRSGAIFLLCCIGCAGAPPSQPSPPKPPPKSSVIPVAVSYSPVAAGAESVKGRVVFPGKVREPRGDPTTVRPCDKHDLRRVAKEEFQVGPDGALSNVVITVSNPPKPVPAAPVDPILIMHWCVFFQPRVVVVQVGQPLIVQNGEHVPHNHHAAPEKNPEFNVGLFKEGESLTKTFERAESAIRLKCDVHPWEVAWVHVVDHPYFAVTGTDGMFEIKGLPAGDYELVAWHERFREKPLIARVKVEAAKTATLDFSFELPSR